MHVSSILFLEKAWKDTENNLRHTHQNHNIRHGDSKPRDVTLTRKTTIEVVHLIINMICLNILNYRNKKNYRVIKVCQNRSKLTYLLNKHTTLQEHDYNMSKIFKWIPDKRFKSEFPIEVKYDTNPCSWMNVNWMSSNGCRWTDENFDWWRRENLSIIKEKVYV